MTKQLPIKLADWQVPDYVKAFTTFRVGGVSAGPYRSLNLAHHVGDEMASVTRNREILKREWFLPSEPYWLHQTHSIDVIELTDKTTERNADASWTKQKDRVCAVMTADCLPLLIYHPDDRVAAIHAGWRGLLDGVIEATIESMTDSPEKCSVWLGPAIGPDAFEVGAEVRDAFVATDSAAAQCFRPVGEDKFLGNLYQLARLRLTSYDIFQVSGGTDCTYTDTANYYSYRRDNVTGRMASVIWMSE